MLKQTILFEHAGVRFTVTVDSKVTVLRGLSGIGKTTLVSNITKYNHAGVPSNVVGIHIDSRNTLEDNLAKIRDDDIVFIDEDMVDAVRENGGLRRLATRKVALVLVYRDILPELTYGVNDVYTLVTEGKSTEMVNMYPSYSILPRDTHYVCEDSNAGFDYFNDKLKSVESMHGRKNCLKFASTGTLIMDGAALGNYIDRLIKVNASLCLPESFEALLLAHTAGLSTDVLHDYVHLQFLTFERYCTYLCESLGVLGVHYRKRGKLPKRLQLVELIDGIHVEDSRLLNSVLKLQPMERRDRYLNTVLDFVGCSEYFEQVAEHLDIYVTPVDDFVPSVLWTLSALGAFGKVERQDD